MFPSPHSVSFSSVWVQSTLHLIFLLDFVRRYLFFFFFFLSKTSLHCSTWKETCMLCEGPSLVCVPTGEKQADWHADNLCRSFWRKFLPEVCEKRIWEVWTNPVSDSGYGNIPGEGHSRHSVWQAVKSRVTSRIARDENHLNIFFCLLCFFSSGCLVMSYNNSAHIKAAAHSNKKHSWCGITMLLKLKCFNWVLVKPRWFLFLSRELICLGL